MKTANATFVPREHLKDFSGSARKAFDEFLHCRRNARSQTWLRKFRQSTRRLPGIRPRVASLTPQWCCCWHWFSFLSQNASAAGGGWPPSNEAWKSAHRWRISRSAARFTGLHGRFTQGGRVLIPERMSCQHQSRKASRSARAAARLCGELKRFG